MGEWHQKDHIYFRFFRNGGIITDTAFQIKTYTVISTNRDELDLMEKQSVDSYLKNNSIDYRIIAAAKVGGIFANDNIKGFYI